MGQSSGVLCKEVAAFRRSPSIEVSLYTEVHLLRDHPQGSVKGACMVFQNKWSLMRGT